MKSIKECKHAHHTGDRFISTDMFGIDNQKRDGLKSYCSICCKIQYNQYYQSNKDAVLKQSALYYENNKQKVQEQHKAHYVNNPQYYANYRIANADKNQEYQLVYRDQHKEERAVYASKYYKKYYPANKHKYIQYVAKRRSAKLKATPNWYEPLQVEKIYEHCANVTSDTKIVHHVDHIVPLQHPLVCGLHCVDNLQVITKEENLKKGNKLIINRDNYGI